MHPIALEFIVILLLILVNGLLAMSEMSVVAARKAVLQQRAEEGDARAARALELANEPGRFLSTVQIGITLVGVLTGAFGGATLARAIGRQLEQWPLLAPYSQAIGVFAVVMIITYLALVLGELAPKRIALTNPEGIAAIMARPLDILARLARPAVAFLTGSTNFVLRIFGINESEATPVTDEEIQMLLQEGARLGVFEPIEEEIVRQLFRLSDQTIDALITPRPDIVWLDVNDPPAVVRRKIEESNHSRYPVADGNLDNVVGQLLVKDLTAREWSEFASVLGSDRETDPESATESDTESDALSDQAFDLTALMRPPLFIPETAPALTVLERFRNTQSKMAMVIDEFGGLLGMVTVDDLVEAIVGDLPDHDEEIGGEVFQREDGSWLIDGMFPLDEFKELVQLTDLPPGVEEYYQTVGGLVMATLGRVPATGDTFTWEDVRIEVLDMDGRRVDKVLAAQIAHNSGGAAEEDIAEADNA